MKGIAVSTTTIENMDVLEWSKTYSGIPFHSCFCDPPYHLSSIVKRFGGKGAAPAKHGKDGAYARASRGFMGKDWDGGDIAFQPETWDAIAKHLHPGAFIFAFAGTRGYHRMAVAMEDSGLILHPLCIWIQGSGFPKASRIDTQIDRAAGMEREVVGQKANKGRAKGVHGGGQNTNSDFDCVTAPATDLARVWAEHRYGLQSLKPSLECIAVAQVPYRGRPVDNITLTGAGSLNIGAGRIATQGERLSFGSRDIGTNGIYQPMAKERQTPGVQDALGRWPSNLLLDEFSAQLLDQQSGHLQSGQPVGVKKAPNAIYGQYGTGIPITGYGDEGGASRFFFRSGWNEEVFERLQATEPFKYTAKAGRLERDAGLETFAVKMAGSISGGGGIHSTGEHAYGRNVHPTVKPLSLCKYLSQLLSPPAEYAPRRLLVPFSGSGSEVCGALLSGGWEHVTGIEQSCEYAEISRARIKFWENNSGLFSEIMQADEEEEIEEQMSLF